MLISDSELSAIRATQLEALPDTAIIRERTLVSDSEGGFETVYSTAGSAQCRLMFAGTNPRLADIAEAMHIAPQELFIVTLPHDADVSETSRLIIQDTAYDVVTSLSTRSWQTAKRMLVKRVPPNASFVLRLLESGDNRLLESGDYRLI